MKIELKHLASYLPYGLKMKAANPSRRMNDIEELCPENMTKLMFLNRKPILLPLSALTEPLDDGSIPIVELAKINGFTPHNYFIELQNDTIVLYGEQFNHPGELLTARFFFELDIYNCNMDKGLEFIDNSVESVFSPLREQVRSFEYLFSDHFDVYGLIDAGLAIDKRTLK